MSHQNRSKTSRRDTDNPTPDMVRELRAEVGLTQTEFGKAGMYSLRACQDWESGERRMHPFVWQAYLHIFGRKELKRADQG